VSNHVIEHVHNVGNYLSEISRILKKNGTLVISLLNVMNPRFFLGMLCADLESKLIEFSKSKLDNYDKAGDHINAWDPIHFCNLCASVGFLLERYMPVEGVPFPFNKLFKPYVNIRIDRVKNLSYTMVFQFKKVKNIVINNND